MSKEASSFYSNFEGRVSDLYNQYTSMPLYFFFICSGTNLQKQEMINHFILFRNELHMFFLFTILTLIGTHAHPHTHIHALTHTYTHTQTHIEHVYNTKHLFWP